MDEGRKRTLSRSQLQELSDEAWVARDCAYTIGPTKVGCAALGVDGLIYTGCNVEHRFRSHDIHAEVNAIGNMVSKGCKELVAIVIAAERDRFTPCGACMDWIYQVGGAGCVVVFSDKVRELHEYTAHDLMPYYPM